MRGALTTASELVGIALVAAGLALIFVPAALVFTGLALFGLGFWNGRS